MGIIDGSKQPQIPIVVHQFNHQGSTKPAYLASTGDVSTISGDGDGSALQASIMLFLADYNNPKLIDWMVMPASAWWPGDSGEIPG